MKIKYQADADLNEMIIKAIKRQAPMIDFQTAHAAGLEGGGDKEVLRIAAREGRILVTHDRKTMPYHFAELVMEQSSAGVVIVSQHMAVGEAAEELILMWTASEAEEWINSISSIPL
jgi:predicted nuclease of predicted toxin-antitoxin system